MDSRFGWHLEMIFQDCVLSIYLNTWTLNCSANKRKYEIKLISWRNTPTVHLMMYQHDISWMNANLFFLNLPIDLQQTGQNISIKCFTQLKDNISFTAKFPLCFCFSIVQWSEVIPIIYRYIYWEVDFDFSNENNKTEKKKKYLLRNFVVKNKMLFK